MITEQGQTNLVVPNAIDAQGFYALGYADTNGRPSTFGSQPNAYSGIPVDIFFQLYDPSYTYTVLTYPTNGILTGTPPNLIYTATNCDASEDSFIFKANDGTNDSAPATVTIIISPDNVYAGAPQAVLVPLNTAVTVNPSSSDDSGLPLGFLPLASPLNGTVTNLTATNFLYTPNPNFEGVDSFSYVAFNNCATVTNTVTLYVVAGPILFHDCNPFGPAVQLDWLLDTNEQAMFPNPPLDLFGFTIYRSVGNATNFTAIGSTGYNDAAWLSYLDTNAVVGQTNYYAVTFEFDDTPYGPVASSPFSNEIEATAQNPADLISADAVWTVVTNLAEPDNVTNLQAPFSHSYPNQYQNLLPLPNSDWPLGTTWSNYTTVVIPTNTDLAQVQYSIAIDNDYWLYVNGTLVDSTNHQGAATWSPFQSFPTGTLQPGTNELDVVIKDEGEELGAGDLDYFSLIVFTNNCQGQ